ncbi:MAG: HEAT repeat domain-containing protein [Planctomycetes bacterium]|nr:HEAT repeat domain-containing protein [Planctomycetota bacterium]
MSRSPLRPRLWFAVALAACSRAPAPVAPAGPPLPPLQLRPLLPEFDALAARRQAPPAAAQRELRDLADLALQIVAADPRTAGRAERALLEHPGAWWVLEPALQHEDLAVRRRAAWLCGRSSQTVLQLPLLLRLKYEKDPETVVWVADALQRLGNDTGLLWLDAAIAERTTADRAGQLAVEALQARGVDLGDEPTWATLRRELQQCVGRWRATGVPSRPDVPAPDAADLEARLAAHLVTPRGWELRPVDDARWVLRQAGALAVPMLCRALQADLHYIRTMPLQVLAELGHAAAAAADAVLPLLGDPLTAAYAARALGAIGARQHLPFLRPLLGHADSELRTAATHALGQLQDQDSAVALRQRLHDPEETMDVRVGAAFALRCLGPDQEAEAFLAEREGRGDYHAPTLARLRETLATLGR